MLRIFVSLVQADVCVSVCVFTHKHTNRCKEIQKNNKSFFFFPIYIAGEKNNSQALLITMRQKRAHPTQ